MRSPTARVPLPTLLLALLTVVAIGCQREGPEETGSPFDQPVDYAPEDTLRVTGTLVDATCHAEMAVQGGDPRTCEGDYVINGYPVGLRDDDRDTVWMLVAVPQSLLDYLTTHVRVSGVVRSRGVLVPQQIDVRDGDDWAAVL